MEIVTAFSKTEFEQIISDSVARCLNGKLNPPAIEKPDKIGIDDASQETGLRKATIYKLSFLNEIPCYRQGKRLLFSRKELMLWLEQRTVRKLPPSDVMTDQLSKVAQRKI